MSSIGTSFRVYRDVMPAPLLLGGHEWVTDGGLETDLIFLKGVDLPEFAAFPLVDDHAGRALLTSYFRDYVAIAAAAGAGVVLETPTWRANPDWATLVGYDAVALDRVNRAAVELVRETVAGMPQALVSGCVGPRGDGYVASATEADQAADYHLPQVTSFAAAGADVVHAMTLSTPDEAIGVVRAARSVGLPVAISFTVETDGALPGWMSFDASTLTFTGTPPSELPPSSDIANKKPSRASSPR